MMKRHLTLRAGLLIVAASFATPMLAQSVTAPTGVPECDAFIVPYEACIRTKLPEAQRAHALDAMQTLKKNLIDMSRNPTTKDSVKTICTTNNATYKQQATGLGCSW